MFRIFFEPKGAYWCIQFLRWGCFWVTVKGGVRKTNTEEVLLSILRFDTHDDAEKYAAERGIDQAYPQQESFHRYETREAVQPMARVVRYRPRPPASMEVVGG